MKTLTLALILTTSALAGELRQHLQTPMIDAYVDSSEDREPDIPGMGKTRYFVSVSLTTIDSQCSYFSVYLKVQLPDGSIHPILASLYRESDGPTTARFSTGHSKPAKILEFYVVRLHPELAEHLITR